MAQLERLKFSNTHGTKKYKKSYGESSKNDDDQGRLEELEEEFFQKEKDYKAAID